VSGRLEDELHVEVDRHVVAEREATGLERSVPVHAELGAVDLGRGLGAELDLAVAVGREAAELGLEDDRLGDATQGQVAGDVQVVALGLDARRAEGELRVLLGEEEVARLEVLVALLLAGVDRRDVDVRLDGRLERVLGGDDGGVEGLELALDLADREVADRERDLGVRGVDLPGSASTNVHLDDAGRRVGRGSCLPADAPSSRRRTRRTSASIPGPTSSEVARSSHQPASLRCSPRVRSFRNERSSVRCRSLSYSIATRASG
jgi:hypothetical protein